MDTAMMELIVTSAAWSSVTGLVIIIAGVIVALHWLRKR
jgi:hypothetical protein